LTIWRRTSTGRARGDDRRRASWFFGPAPILAIQVVNAGDMLWKSPAGAKSAPRPPRVNRRHGALLDTVLLRIRFRARFDGLPQFSAGEVLLAKFDKFISIGKQVTNGGVGTVVGGNCLPWRRFVHGSEILPTRSIERVRHAALIGTAWATARKSAPIVRRRRALKRPDAHPTNVRQISADHIQLIFEILDVVRW